MTDPRTLWQAQAEPVQTLSPEEVQVASDTLTHRSQWRELRVYLAALVWMPWFVWQTYSHADLPLISWGSVLILLAGLYSIWEMQGHSRERRAAQDANFLDAYRSQLALELGALRRLQKWHLVPFLPGLALIIAGAIQVEPPFGPRGFVNELVLVILFLALLRWINARAISGLQNELDAIGGGPENGGEQ